MDHRAPKPETVGARHHRRARCGGTWPSWPHSWPAGCVSRSRPWPSTASTKRGWSTPSCGGATPPPSRVTVSLPTGTCRPVVDLRAERDLNVPTAVLDDVGIELVRIPIRDGQTPNAEQAAQFVDVVPRGVYVHCGAGVGRAGVMAATYLVAQGETSSWQARWAGTWPSGRCRRADRLRRIPRHRRRIRATPGMGGTREPVPRRAPPAGVRPTSPAPVGQAARGRPPRPDRARGWGHRGTDHVGGDRPALEQD